MIAQYKKILITLLLSATMIFALTGGPSMPEYTSFAEFDAKDLVDLNTGNFHYTIPLMEVPGNGGSYPITLGYYSGIKHHQEASWVGLGWNLNAGAISRTVREYADDYYNALIKTHIYDPGQEGWGMSIGAGYGPFGGTVSFDSNTGFGLVSSISVLGAIGRSNTAVADMLKSSRIVPDIGLSLGYANGGGVADISVGISARTIKTQGVNIGLRLGGSIGTSGASASVKLKANHEDTRYKFEKNGFGTYMLNTYSNTSALGSLGYTWNSRGSSGFGYSVASGSISSSNTNITDNDIIQSSSSFSLHIPILETGAWVSLGAYWWSWYLDLTALEHTHGYLYQGGDATLYGPVSERGTTDDKGKTLERHKSSDRLYPSQDFYFCNGMGISGSFLPYAQNPVILIDSAKNAQGRERHARYLDKNGSPINAYNTFAALKENLIQDEYVNYSDEHINNVLAHSKMKFRFTNDLGGNFVTTGYEDFKEMTTAYPIRSGKQILPIVNNVTGLLSGFDIIDVDGKKYEFRKALYNRAHASYAIDTPDELAWGDTEDRKYNKQMNTAPFAYTWLITAIKSPDYIDCGEAGPDEEDYGFWVKFTYQGANESSEIPSQYVWRAPFYGTERVADRSYTASLGIKDVAYLRSIETSTHKAIFDNSDRKDMMGISKERFNREANVFFENDFRGISGYYDNGYVRLEIDQPYAGHILNIINNAAGTSYNLEFIRTEIREREYGAGYLTSKKDTVYEEISSNQVESVVYLEQEKKLTLYTNIPIKESEYLDEAESGLKVSCNTTIILSDYFHSYGLLQDFSDINKKCDEITLINKATNKEVKKVAFNYDYSLCTGIPNAMNAEGAHGTIGKLTLKSIKSSVLTRNGKWASIPEYKFGYNTPGGNPVFTNTKDYDIWGMHSTLGENNKHVTYQEPKMGIAWNLTDILTPEGTKVEIEYERDEYFGVGNKYITAFEMPVHEKIQKMNSIDELQDGDKFVVFVDFKLEKMSEVLYTTPNDVEVVKGQGVSAVNQGQCFCPVVFAKDDEYGKIVLDNVKGNFAWDPKHPQNSEHQWGDSVSTRTAYANYEIYKLTDNFNFYGGDIRTKRIVTQNLLGDWNATEYSYYEYEKGLLSSKSSGRTSKSPYIRKENDGGEDFFYFGKQGTPISLRTYKTTDEFDYYTSDPGVTYKTVTVEMESSKDKATTKRGKMVYQFYGVDDSVEVTTATGVEKRKIYHEDKAGLHDYSAIVGQLRSMSMYNADGRLVQKDSTEYYFSEELPQTAQWLVRETGTERDSLAYSNEAIGAIAEMHDYNIEYKENFPKPHKRFKRIMNNVIKKAHITTVDNMQSKVSFLAYDPLTGNPLITYGENPDASVDPQLTVVKPAYVDNEEMAKRRMLSQTSLTATLRDTIDALTQKRDSGGDVIISANYYEWQQQALPSNALTANPAFYKWKEWNWIGDSITPTNNSYNFIPGGSTAQNYQWENFSYVTAFNNWGVPYEEYNSYYDMYTTIIPGYSDYRVVATASNAKNSEVLYTSFEPYSTKFNDIWTISSFINSKDFLLDTDAFSGGFSLHCYGTFAIEKDIPSGSLYPDKIYNLSTVVKINDAQSGSVKLSLGEKDTLITIESVDENRWIRYDLEAAYNSGDWKVRIEGANCLIDEVRFHPLESEMTTFSFDMLTENMITSCDVNSRRKSFTFDHFGRLTQMKNHNGDIIGGSNYSYLRDSLKELSLLEPVDKKHLFFGETVNFKWTSAKLYNRATYSLFLLSPDGDTIKFESLKDTTLSTAISQRGDLRKYSWWVEVESELGIRFTSEKRIVVEYPSDVFFIRDITHSIVPRIPSDLYDEIKAELSETNQQKFEASYVHDGYGWANFQYADLFATEMGSGNTLKVSVKRKADKGWRDNGGVDGKAAGKGNSTKAIEKVRFDLQKGVDERYKSILDNCYLFAKFGGKDNKASVDGFGLDLEYRDRYIKAFRAKVTSDSDPTDDNIHIWYDIREDWDWQDDWVKDGIFQGDGDNEFTELVRAMILIYETGK